MVCWEESQLAQVHKLPSAPAGLTVAHKLRKGSQSVPGQVKGKLGHQINGIATEILLAKAELGHVSQEVGRGP